MSKMYTDEQKVKAQWMALSVGETLEGVPAAMYNSVTSAISRERWATDWDWTTRADRERKTFSITRTK